MTTSTELEEWGATARREQGFRETIQLTEFDKRGVTSVMQHELWRYDERSSQTSCEPCVDRDNTEGSQMTTEPEDRSMDDETSSVDETTESEIWSEEPSMCNEGRVAAGDVEHEQTRAVHGATGPIQCNDGTVTHSLGEVNLANAGFEPIEVTDGTIPSRMTLRCNLTSQPDVAPFLDRFQEIYSREVRSMRWGLCCTMVGGAAALITVTCNYPYELVLTLSGGGEVRRPAGEEHIHDLCVVGKEILAAVPASNQIQCYRSPDLSHNRSVSVGVECQSIDAIGENIAVGYISDDNQGVVRIVTSNGRMIAESTSLGQAVYIRTSVSSTADRIYATTAYRTPYKSRIIVLSRDLQTILGSRGLVAYVTSMCALPSGFLVGMYDGSIHMYDDIASHMREINLNLISILGITFDEERNRLACIECVGITKCWLRVYEETRRGTKRGSENRDG